MVFPTSRCGAACVVAGVLLIGCGSDRAVDSTATAGSPVSAVIDPGDGGDYHP